MVAIVRHLPWALSLVCLAAVARDPRPASGSHPGLRAPITAALPHGAIDPAVWDLRADWQHERRALGPITATGGTLRWRLLGDYYFAPTLGLRATSGLLGQTEPDSSVRLGQALPRPRPYVGLGYSIGGAETARTSRWGLSADIGWQGTRGTGTGRALDGSADWLRDLRFSPMLQVGVSYEF
jgi:hypothetical protein